MWKRNLLFGVLCLTGLGTLSGMLLRRERIGDPRAFSPQRYQSAQYRSVIEQLNHEFRQHWKKQGFQPTLPADELALTRRLSLGLTGSLPSVEELRVLEQQPEGDRLDWWLSRLLEHRRCSDYVAERLARAYVGTDQGPFLVFRRRRFVTWLSDQLMANRPYDEVVQEMITAKGLWTDSPAVNFLTATAGGNEKNQPDDIKLAGRTSRAFLATRVDCVQCHDDKLGTIQLGTADEPRDAEQRDFHQLAAFFCEAQTSLLGIHDSPQDYKYKYLEAETEEVVAPRAPFLQELVSPEPTRRAQLAAWVTHPDNKPFARAIVNRYWALLFGKPLVEPVDSIPLNGPFPPGLEILANDFVKHQFDLHRLIRVIAATDIFSLDSRAEFEITPQHENAWCVFPLSRLRPEQVAGSILQSASLTTIDASSHVFAQVVRSFQQSGFVQRYGDIGEDEFTAQPSTITQRLLMMNGELVHDRTKDNPFTNAATRIAILAPDDKLAIEMAYLAVLTRRPSSVELAHFQPHLEKQTGNDRTRALEDLFWALINSSEFSWNH